jgi:hypothetical protein
VGLTIARANSALSATSTAISGRPPEAAALDRVQRPAGPGPPAGAGRDGGVDHRAGRWSPRSRSAPPWRDVAGS